MAALAAHAQKAVLQSPALQIPFELRLHVRRQRPTRRLARGDECRIVLLTGLPVRAHDVVYTTVENGLVASVQWRAQLVLNHRVVGRIGTKHDGCGSRRRDAVVGNLIEATIALDRDPAIGLDDVVNDAGSNRRAEKPAHTGSIAQTDPSVLARCWLAGDACDRDVVDEATR